MRGLSDWLNNQSSKLDPGAVDRVGDRLHHLERNALSAPEHAAPRAGVLGLRAILPEPRGEISEHLLAELTQPVHPLIAPLVVPPADPLADEDVQLALYLCYELHYRGLPGV